MDQSLAQKILVKIGLAIFAIALIDLVYLNYWIIKRQTPEFGNQRSVSNTQVIPSPNASLSTDKALLSASPSILPSAKPTPSAAPAQSPAVQTVVQQQTIVQNAQREIFIPIGSGSSQNNSYVDLDGLQVTIDTTKYGTIASADFEASIYVTGGNGKMYAQLFNKTDGHPVWNSAISTVSASGVLVVSSPIVLDGGSKTYSVQAKTDLTAYPANVNNARIKITLK